MGGVQILEKLKKYIEDLVGSTQIVKCKNKVFEVVKISNTQLTSLKVKKRFCCFNSLVIKSLDQLWKLSSSNCSSSQRMTNISLKFTWLFDHQFCCLFVKGIIWIWF